MSTINGSCLCGKIEYKIKEPFIFFNYCHCSLCRKVTGSAHASNILLKKSQFEWVKGEEFLKIYKLPTSKVFTSSFCSECGSTMPWEIKDKDSMIVPAGTLNGTPKQLPQRNIFWDSKADWFIETSELPKFEEGPTNKN